MKNDVIPFGKYKNQPLRTLENDPEYCEWVISQPGLKQRYPTVINFIINNFSKELETPEHNAIQAKFLDFVFCAKIVRKHIEYQVEKNGKVIYSYNYGDFGKGLSETTVHYLKGSSEITGVESIKIISCEFEHKDGSDVVIKSLIKKKATRLFDLTPETVIEKHHALFGVEIKPLVGDDYPSIFRQMKRQNSVILYVNKFQSEVIDRKQLKDFFFTENCSVIFEDEIS